MLKKVLQYKSGINKTFVINFFSTIMLQGISFFTVPIFSRLLGSEQYGLYALFNSWVAIFSAFLALNISSSIPSGMYEFKNNYYEYRNNTLFYTLATSIIMSVICVALYPLINRIIKYDLTLYIILLLTSISTIIINAVFSILSFEKKALLKFIISFLLSISTVALSLLFIHYKVFEKNYISRIVGHFLPYLSTSILLIIYFFVLKKFRLTLKYFKYGVLFGLPLIGHTLAGVLLTQSDRLMMDIMSIRMSFIGVYSLFFSFSSIMSIILYAFNTSFTPFYYEFIDSNDEKTLSIKAKNYIECYTVLSIGFILLSREVSHIMANKEFYDGINLIPIFVTSIYFIFMYHFPVNFEFFYKKTNYIAIGTLLSTVLNIIMNFIFIKKFGMYGAAIATLFAHFFEFLFHYIIATNMKKDRYYITIKYFYISILCYLLSVLVFYFFRNQIVLRWIMGFFVGIYEIFRVYKRKCFF